MWQNKLKRRREAREATKDQKILFTKLQVEDRAVAMTSSGIIPMRLDHRTMTWVNA